MGPLKRQLLGTDRATCGRAGTSLRACAAATAPMAATDPSLDGHSGGVPDPWSGDSGGSRVVRERLTWTKVGRASWPAKRGMAQTSESRQPGGPERDVSGCFAGEGSDRRWRSPRQAL